jgi:hypothetical protein
MREVLGLAIFLRPAQERHIELWGQHSDLSREYRDCAKAKYRRVFSNETTK